MLLRKRHHNLPGGRANLVIFSHHENKNCYPQLKYYCDEVVFQSESHLCWILYKHTGLTTDRISLTFILICLEDKQFRVLILSL